MVNMRVDVLESGQEEERGTLPLRNATYIVATTRAGRRRTYECKEYGAEHNALTSGDSVRGEARVNRFGFNFHVRTWWEGKGNLDYSVKEGSNVLAAGGGGPVT